MQASKPAGILVSVADPRVLTEDIDAAVAAGIPVITVDADAVSSKRLFFVGTNNYEAGQIGGRTAAKELNGNGKGRSGSTDIAASLRSTRKSS